MVFISQEKKKNQKYIKYELTSESLSSDLSSFSSSTVKKNFIAATITCNETKLEEYTFSK